MDAFTRYVLDKPVERYVVEDVDCHGVPRYTVRLRDDDGSELNIVMPVTDWMYVAKVVQEKTRSLADPPQRVADTVSRDVDTGHLEFNRDVPEYVKRAGEVT